MTTKQLIGLRVTFAFGSQCIVQKVSLAKIMEHFGLRYEFLITTQIIHAMSNAKKATGAK